MCEDSLAILDYILSNILHIIQVRGAHVFWKEFSSRLSQGAAVTEGGAVSHTRDQLKAAVHAKRSIEAIELIPEVCAHVCVYIPYSGLISKGFYFRIFRRDLSLRK